MNVAILGCGYVADFYMATRSVYPELKVVGAYDLLPERRAAFARHYGVHAYSDLQALLEDTQVSLVLNLTNPRSHFETTRDCLLAGKHVYSEKPLAMDSVAARELAQLAQQQGLSLATAPCSLLSETAQTLWKGVRDEAVGPIRLVYASFDDGMVHLHHPERWVSPSGAVWPARDEYEVGCTYEHAAYVLSWLAAIFGPARRVTAQAAVCLPDKGIAVDSMAPDFTVGCIEYDHGVIARVTCSIVAPLDKSITIIGDRGILYTKYVRNDGSPVYIKRFPPNRVLKGIATRCHHLQVRLEQLLRLPFSFSPPKWERKYPYARPPKFRSSGTNKPVDFLRGPAEMAQALAERRPCRLSADLGVHLLEVIETLQYPERFQSPRVIESSFDPIDPLPWRT